MIIQLNKKTGSIVLKKDKRTIKLTQVGRRGPKGDQGDPGEVLVQSVNGKQGTVVLEPADIGLAPFSTDEFDGASIATALDMNDQSIINVADAISPKDAVNLDVLDFKLEFKQDSLGYVPENAANKGQPDGYASLDGSGKVPDSQLPPKVDKNELVYDVKDYGAVGDGTANDSAAIQAAVNAAAASQYKGIVYLPPGRYRLNSAIVPKSGVTIRGAGYGKSVLLPYGIVSAIQDIVSFSAASPLTNVSFEDFEIDGINQTLTSGSYNVQTKGIFILYMKRLTFRNLYIHDTAATGLGCDYFQDSLIENVIARGCGRLNSGSDPGGSGIGIGIGELNNLFENLVITNCHALDNKVNGIFIESQDASHRPFGTVIANCVAKGNKIGIGLCGGTGTVVSNNVVYANTQDGIDVYPGTFGSPTPDRQTIIANNTVYGNANIGIRLSATSGKILEGYKIHGNRVWGNLTGIGSTNTDTVSKYIDISDNHVFEQSNAGIQLLTAGSGTYERVKIQNNTVWNNGRLHATIKQAIRIGANVKDLQVVNNRCFDDQVSKTQTYGLEIATGVTINGGRFVNNDFTENLSNEFLLNGTLTNVEMQFNKGRVSDKLTANGFDANSNRITSVTDPSGAQDAATKGYVDTSIAALVNAAPATLDTLDELANALGDDANFATTITTLIGTKANDSDVVHLSGAETITGTKSLAAGKSLFVYNTADQTTNLERGRLYWSANELRIGTEAAGTGVSRPIKMAASGLFGIGELQVNPTSANGIVRVFLQSNAVSAMAMTVGATFSASSGVQTVFSLNPTINQSGTAGYTADLINVTETATGSGAKNLLDYQVGGASKFKVSNIGAANLADSLDIGSYGSLVIAQSAPLKMTVTADSIAGVEMTNRSTGTTADFRFMVLDTTNHYLAFAVPGVNNSGTLFGYQRNTGDFIFNNGGTARRLVIGTITANEVNLGTQGAIRLTLGAGLADGMTIQDGYNVNVGTTTGTKFGTATTQKIGFYGATPIVKQTGVAVSAAGIHAALVNLGLIT